MLFLCGFLSRTFTNDKTTMGTERSFLTPLYHSHLLHAYWDNRQAIIAQSSPLHINRWQDTKVKVANHDAMHPVSNLTRCSNNFLRTYLLHTSYLSCSRLLVCCYAQDKLYRRCFTINFMKFFQIDVMKNISGWVLLNIKLLTMCARFKRLQSSVLVLLLSKSDISSIEHWCCQVTCASK